MGEVGGGEKAERRDGGGSFYEQASKRRAGVPVIFLLCACYMSERGRACGCVCAYVRACARALRLQLVH